jgi:hypothetical protein
MDHISEGGKHAGDAIALIAAVGTLAQFLPPLAALFTIIWYAVKLYDRFFGKPRDD